LNFVLDDDAAIMRRMLHVRRARCCETGRSSHRPKPAQSTRRALALRAVAPAHGPLRYSDCQASDRGPWRRSAWPSWLRDQSAFVPPRRKARFGSPLAVLPNLAVVKMTGWRDTGDRPLRRGHLRGCGAQRYAGGRARLGGLKPEVRRRVSGRSRNVAPTRRIAEPFAKKARAVRT
jgi:hypothetical protein